MPNRLAQFVKDELSGRQFIVVSNREPYIHKKAGSGTRVERPAGGLTTALDDVLRATGGTWVAWGSGSGDRDSVDKDDRVAVPVDAPSYTLKRVWLTASEMENYYHGYSNQVLWPLCHIALDRVYFRKRFWEDYVRANRAFAAAVLEEIRDEPAIWIQDYHLCLVPRFIREKNPDVTLSHFWHIPWPDWSVYRVCPQAKELLEGLLGNDIIGFQIPLFVKNFIDCVKECLDVEIDYQRATITWNGHVTVLTASPISIDFDKFNDMASSPRTAQAMKHLRSRYRLPQFVGIGVDRLEYTKALLKRLQAIALFFERYETLRGRFTFIQIAVPTRMKEPYLSYQKAVEELVAKINSRYARNDWQPIVYIDTKVEHRDLVAYYRLADVAVISSIYDGMNLVAKEYAAAQVDGKGALILSELAGAADELEGAILVNPYDVEGFSTSIRTALFLPPKARQERMAILRRQVRDHDIYRWIHDILEEIVRVDTCKHNGASSVFEQEMQFRDFLAGKELFLFFDYDGTLAPIADSPEKAGISHSTFMLVARLAELAPVAVVSGRSVDDVQGRLGLDGILYAGNHGSEIRQGDTMLITRESENTRRFLEEILARLRNRLAPYPGVLIEDKGLTVSVHYRLVEMKDLADVALLFRKIAKEYDQEFQVTSGKKVFEIRPKGAWNKGDAVTWIMENLGNGRTPLYVGDDITDEDAFRSIKGRGISISVGENAYADYYLNKQEEIDRLLELLIEYTGNEKGRGL